MVKHFILLSQMLIQLKNRSNIPAPMGDVTFPNEKQYTCDSPIAIIWRTPNGDNCTVKHEFVALHRKLVGTGYEIDGIGVRKCFGDVGSEEETSPAGGEAPTRNVVRI